MPKDAPPNGGAPSEGDNAGDLPVGSRRRVSEMQAKLHRWVGPGFLNQPTDRDHGEPGAMKVARRVRRAAWGNGPVAMLAPRPRPTPPGGRASSESHSRA